MASAFKDYLKSTMAWVAEKEISFAAALMKHGIESYSGEAFDKLVSEQVRKKRNASRAFGCGGSIIKTFTPRSDHSLVLLVVGPGGKVPRDHL